MSVGARGTGAAHSPSPSDHKSPRPNHQNTRAFYRVSLENRLLDYKVLSVAS